MTAGHAAIVVAALLLASCGDRTETSVNTTIANDMPADNDTAMVPADNADALANKTAVGAASASVSYDCKPAMTLAVRYDNDAKPDGQAVVTLDGKNYTLDHVMSGSGARYLTSSGRTPGASLVWWNKGRDGMLMEGKADDPAADEKTIATCTERG